MSGETVEIPTCNKTKVENTPFVGDELIYVNLILKC